MEFSSTHVELSEIKEFRAENINDFDKEALAKYDKMFGGEVSDINAKKDIISYEEAIKKYDSMFTEKRSELKNADENELAKNCPIENGKWTGERGNSKWIPDDDFVPQKSNPEGKNFGEILKQYGIDGIEYDEGEPDFDSISKGDVKIEEFSTSRTDNFDNADIELAQQKGCSPEDVEKWRKDNGYTWHECRDMETMQKVPSIVHNNVTHRGGISAAKNGGN